MFLRQMQKLRDAGKTEEYTRNEEQKRVNTRVNLNEQLLYKIIMCGSNTELKYMTIIT